MESSNYNQHNTQYAIFRRVVLCVLTLEIKTMMFTIVLQFGVISDNHALNCTRLLSTMCLVTLNYPHSLPWTADPVWLKSKVQLLVSRKNDWSKAMFMVQSELQFFQLQTEQKKATTKKKHHVWKNETHKSFIRLKWPH